MVQLSHPSPLEQSLQKLLDRRKANSTLRQLTVSPQNSIDFSSNDFLSLSTSPALKASFSHELERTHDLPIGSGGSRLLDGNSVYAEVLEQEISRFHNAPAGLLFNSGFDANAGFFSCIPQAGDIVVYDELIHASVHDGMRLSRASKCISFAHNSVSSLRRVLEDCVRRNDEIRAGLCHVFIAVEAIYSMDGDLAPLAAIVECVDTVVPENMGYIVVDEAHSTGVLGPRGRGLVCELGLEDRIFARLHTFGKALACNGAIMLCSAVVRQYLINYARPLIYTTFMGYPSLAAIRAAYELLWEGRTEKLAAHLKTLVSILFNQLQALQSKHSFALAAHPVLQVPSQCPKSPIFSILSENAKPLASFLQSQGFMVRAVVPPTVPQNGSRIRVCLHAGNTAAEIEALVRAMDSWITIQLSKTQGMLEEEDSPLKARL